MQMNEKRQKLARGVATIPLAAIGVQVVTMIAPGIGTIPAPEIMGSMALTLLQVQGIVPDALPLPVETAPVVFSVVEGFLVGHGVPLPIGLASGLFVAGLGATLKRRINK